MNDPSRRVGALLNAVPAIKAISMQLEAAAALQRALARALPAALAPHCRVLHCREGLVLIEAAHGAAAARLRLLRARLLPVLKNVRPDVREIRIVVDVARQSAKAGPAGRRLNPTAQAAWRQLASSLPEGPLREACRGMLPSQDASDRQEQTLEEQEGQHGGGHE